jgi:hypothetical protein
MLNTIGCRDVKKSLGMLKYSNQSCSSNQYKAISVRINFQRLKQVHLSRKFNSFKNSK